VVNELLTLKKIATAKTEEEYSKLLPMNIEQYDLTSNLEDLWQIYFSEDFEQADQPWPNVTRT